VIITKSACTPVEVRFATPVFPGSAASCDRWRASAIRWLRANRPDVIIVASSVGYRLVDRSGRRITHKPTISRLWGDGWAATLSALPAGSAKAILGDTPHLRIDPPVCLAANPRRIASCQTPRARGFRLSRDATEREVAAAQGATFLDPDDLVCSYDPCPVIVGDVLMWRDRSHLTATFARQLAPWFVTILEELASRP
jgi:hypothetical protein